MVLVEWEEDCDEINLQAYESELCWCKCDDELANFASPNPSVLRHCEMHRDPDNPYFVSGEVILSHAT